MIHPERRQENLKKIEEMDKRDAELLQPDWKTWCMNKKVDMVEVVRCKDCKKIGYTNCHWFCKWLNRCVDEDWYCADGERKYIGYLYCQEPTKCKAWRLHKNYKKGGKWYDSRPEKVVKQE